MTTATDQNLVEGAETAPAIDRVGVVGCGVMGAGIAEFFARGGLDVKVVVSTALSVQAGQARVTRSLDHGVRRGRIDPRERDAALERITFTADLSELADRQLVVEAIREAEATKLEVFATLDKVIEDEDVILASTTSSIPIGRLVRATRRPGRVVGTHFFNPVPVMPLVEVIGSLQTAPRTRERVGALLESLGKTVIHTPDRAGFVVNALLIPYLLAAIRMVESGFVSAEIVDTGMTLGCQHPMGPLTLADLIGLDVVAAVARALYEEFKEPLYAPPPLLLRLVDAGYLGKKSGAGFHRYS